MTTHIKSCDQCKAKIDADSKTGAALILPNPKDAFRPVFTFDFCSEACAEGFLAARREEQEKAQAADEAAHEVAE